MKTKFSLVIMLALALTLPVATLLIAQQTRTSRNGPPRPEGPCDVYAAAKTPCVAAHSSTRAMYASYNGPLYQVMRQSDGKTLDIGVVQPSATDAGGYADAAKQDAFCANTYCWITTLYDQSGHHNEVTQAPRGPAGTPMVMGGFNNVPVADWAPVTVMGHKVYGVFIVPGMGLRNDNPHGTAVDDQAEGQYWVVNGHHYNGGCCFDYGNGETDSRDDGDGTMETTYFGNANVWYHGPAPGPWIMSDQENNLVGCVTDSPNNKNCDIPVIPWRFVAATMDGEPHHWRTMGGDAQRGEMQIIYDGKRVQNTRNSYDPMRKQGAIILGNGGDNSNGSQGTFYEGAMTAANTFPPRETNEKLQANIVAAKYDVARLSITPASATDTPPGLQTFSPGSSQDTTVTFKNVTGAPVSDVNLSISAPRGWNVVANNSATIPGPVAPGASVSATFKITSGKSAFNGDLIAKASWKSDGREQSDSATEKVRNVSPVKVNEFANGATDSFIELYNVGDSEVDLSNWVLTEHPMAQPIYSAVKIPSGTKLTAKGFYVFGLSDSGLVVPAEKGDATLYVRNTAGMSVGDTLQIDTGSAMETRKIASLGTAAGAGTTVSQTLPDGPIITIPPGSTSVPYGGGFGGGGLQLEAGQKIAIGYGTTIPAVANNMEKLEVVTVTTVGKPTTQTYLAADAKAGDTSIRVRNASNISVGDKINLDIDSVGHGTETITVKSIGTPAGSGGTNSSGISGDNAGRRGGGGGMELVLSAPLKFDHSSNLPFANRGTGISFKPATKHVHTSNEPILPLGTGITLDKPLSSDHAINAVVRDEKVVTVGFQGNPNQWFGGPALGNDGTIVLRDSDNHVVDSLNYGRVADPWAAEGFQGNPGSGCSVPSLGAGRGGFGGRGGPAAMSRSAGRFPDGSDTDSNCNDFHLQTSSALALDSAAGANNIKVASVADFRAGQTITIDTGANGENAVIQTVGTPGATTASTNTDIGVTVIPVANAFGFSAGQTVTIDSGANQETAVVASVSGGGRRGGFGGGRGGGGGASITVSGPLKMTHTEGAHVSGSGITLTSALTKAHDSGAQVSSYVPTPGAPNQYARRNQ
jgi:hypothetical protein